MEAVSNSFHDGCDVHVSFLPYMLACSSHIIANGLMLLQSNKGVHHAEALSLVGANKTELPLIG